MNTSFGRSRVITPVLVSIRGEHRAHELPPSYQDQISLDVRSDVETRFRLCIWSVIPTPSSVNLALRQPTWQSSISGSRTSDKAVDGNKDTTATYGVCAVTDVDPSPWLAVDLGKPTDVYGAAVTNRGDCCPG